MEELDKLKKKSKKLRIIMIVFAIIILLLLGEIYIWHDNTYSPGYLSTEMMIFNSKFEGYMGSNLKYSTVVECITSIKSNNENEYLHHVNCNISSIEELEKEKTYTIDCEYDDYRYINSIIIKQEGE